MLSCKRATIAVAAKLIIAFSSGAAAENPHIQTNLINDLNLWIDAATNLPPADMDAEIVFADARDIADPVEMASMIGTVPRGLYDPDTGTITLVRPWSAQDPQDVAVLLHEFVHHRQSNKHYYCEAAKEHSAYSIQKDWLAENGLSLNVNWIAVVLASSCAARDIHP